MLVVPVCRDLPHRAIIHSPSGLHERVAVLEASRGLQVVEETVHLLVARHERGGVVVPGRTEHTVRVGHPGELGRIGHGGNVREPPARRRVESLRDGQHSDRFIVGTEQDVMRVGSSWVKSTQRTEQGALGRIGWSDCTAALTPVRYIFIYILCSVPTPPPSPP